MSQDAKPDGAAAKEPKVFISYSWSSPAHQEEIHQHAKRLMGDGIEVVFDLWDLKEGQDKNAFMEQMVADPSVTYVLVFCDAEYVRKADARKPGGVGTESQIVSQEVYASVDQTKFIPIFCELDETGQPCLPVFFKSRFGIDFSTPEKVAENWEKLIRRLHGKPLYEKPALGKRPAYLDDTNASPPSPTRGKLTALQQVVLNGRPGIPIYRKALVRAACEYVNSLRPKERPPGRPTSEQVIADFNRSLPIRDDLATWVLVEAQANANAEFVDGLHASLEEVLSVRFRTKETESWQDHYSDAFALFVYNFFLHVVAALIQAGRFEVLHRLFSANYLMPQTERHHGVDSVPFTIFRGYSEALANSGENPHLDGLSPAAGLFKKTATVAEFPFGSLMEAELLAFFVALVKRPNKWYPTTLVLAGHNPRFPLFFRARNRHDFHKLAQITGINDANKLRQEVRTGLEAFGVRQWAPFRLQSFDFWKVMNMDQLDTSP